MTAQTLEIITDSTCDIPPELAQQYAITILPHVVVWGEEQFRDRVDMQPEAFYRRLVSDPRYPSTAHATHLDFLNAYRAAAERGAQEVLVLTVSSAMSGTFDAARQAAADVDFPVQVVDSKGPSMSLGWQVLAAAREREQGRPLAEILAKIEQVRRSMVQIVAMDSIEYLHKGGRIGNAKHLLGTLLNIKPVVYIDHNSGLGESAGTARNPKKMGDLRVVEFFGRRGKAK
ncbi:MAG TPA: DegV family protein [Anaerolinea sp.]|nr:DegV family protein [Anaerolinea sp.]